MSKKIKKINEFVDDEFELEIDNTDLTEEEIKLRKEEHDRVVEENLKSFPKRTTPNFTIDELREIIMGLEDYPNLTQEELDELDRDCMEMYGEPFFKK